MFHCVLAFAFILPALIVSGQNSSDWSKNGGGSWTTSGNWDSGVADGADETASFGFFSVPTTLTTTLDGARTIGSLDFTGTTGYTWTLSTGSGGPLTLDDDIDAYSSITVFNANQTVLISVVITGTNGLQKLNDGTLILTATNTYTGGTLIGDVGIDGGVFIVNGAITDPLTLTNFSGTLGGTGVISSPVVVAAGAVLAPGNAAIGTLSISNSLTLLPKSKTLMDISASTSAHSAIQGLSAISYNGTLIVSNLAGSPAFGQSFSLFNGATATAGNFTNITPQLTSGLRWRFNPSTGVLTAVSTTSQPQIAGINQSGANAILRIVNGAPAVTNYTIVATNLATPLANWSRIATNIFDVSGSLLFTNVISTTTPQRFYRLLVPPQN